MCKRHSGPCAAIDVGTNTTLLLVAEVANHKAEVLWDRSRVTALGRAAGPDGTLHPDSIQRTLEGILDAGEEAQELGVEPAKLILTGTAALRRAPNKRTLLDALQERGLKLEVIGGEVEAHWSALAVSLALPQLTHPLVIDVGGGSTEFCLHAPSAWRRSFPCGSVRLTEECLSGDPPTRNSVHGARDQVRMLFKNLPAVEGHPVVGVGGTATTLAAVEQGLTHYDPKLVHGRDLSAKALGRISKEITSLSSSQREAIGMAPGRARVAAGGAILLEEALRAVGGDSLVVCDSGLRHGALAHHFGIQSYTRLFPPPSPPPVKS